MVVPQLADRTSPKRVPRCDSQNFQVGKYHEERHQVLHAGCSSEQAVANVENKKVGVRGLVTRGFK